MASSSFWWSWLRGSPMAPSQFFMPIVTRHRLWCLAMGTLMSLSASTKSWMMSQSLSHSPLMAIFLTRRGLTKGTSAPAALAAAWMPERT